MKKLTCLLLAALLCRLPNAALSAPLSFDVGAPVVVEKASAEEPAQSVSVRVTWEQPALEYEWRDGAWQPLPCEAAVTVTNQSAGVDVVVTLACQKDFWDSGAAYESVSTGRLGCLGADCAYGGNVEETVRYRFVPPDTRLSDEQMDAIVGKTFSAVLTVSVDGTAHGAADPAGS